MRPLENGARAYREILFAGEATEVSGALADLDALQRTAARADGFSVPAALFQVQPGGFRVRELFEEFVMADCDFFPRRCPIYGRILRPPDQGVRYISPSSDT
jgi:hypothetical protein